MNGINLLEMEASDMLDVIHYFFEEDMNYSTAEQAKAHEKLRESVYRNLYDTTYKYGSSGSSRTYTASNGDDDFLDESVDGPEDNLNDIQPFNPRKQATKPFIPATDLSKPNSILDGPIG